VGGGGREGKLMPEGKLMFSFKEGIEV